MAIIQNAEIFFAKLDPTKPNSRFDPINPTWEVQIRTRDKKQAKLWKDMNINVKPDEDDSGMFYKANLKKKSIKKNGEPNNPPNLVGGDLSPIDPNTLGNGSTANVRVFQYDWEVGGKSGIASMLMAVQVTTLKEYTPKPREDDFAMTEMEVIKVADNQSVDEDQFAQSNEAGEDINF